MAAAKLVLVITPNVHDVTMKPLDTVLLVYYTYVAMNIPLLNGGKVQVRPDACNVSTLTAARLRSSRHNNNNPNSSQLSGAVLLVTPTNDQRITV